MDNFKVEFEGLDEVCELFQNAPKTAIPQALLHALAAAGEVIESAMVAELAPHSKTGELLEDLATTVTLDSEFRGGFSATGFSHGGSESKGYGMDYVARFVEYGHRMIGHKPEKKDLGKEIEPHPFMRPAADYSAEAAIDTFEAVLTEGLQSSGLVDAA